MSSSSSVSHYQFSRNKLLTTDDLVFIQIHVEKVFQTKKMIDKDKCLFDEGTAEFDRVPVVDLHSDNLHDYAAQIKDAISSASFVAIDCVRYLDHKFFSLTYLK